MRKHEKSKKNFFYNMKQYVFNNIKQYLIIATIFLIGIVVGIIVVNYLQDESKNQINETITTFIKYLKDDSYKIEYASVFKSVMIKHILFTLCLWFLGCSVVGLPVVYILIGYKGFSLGYTISSIIFTLGMGKGTGFVFLSLFLQNIFVIPAILSIAVSGSNLYKSIIKNKRIENIKIGIIRHTFFCIFMLVFLMIASFVEVYISGFLIDTCTNFF